MKDASGQRRAATESQLSNLRARVGTLERQVAELMEMVIRLSERVNEKN